MISVNSLHAGYGGNEVLHGISFALDKGENLSIIGPNGCGKTTLLRALAGVLPFSGEVLLDGIGLGKMKRRALAKKISMLSQTAVMHFNYSVYDTVMMGRYAHAGGGLFSGITEQDKCAVAAALKTVGMLELKDRGVDTLSGGQLQRVFFAKILAQDPEVILLDEPTNHLDLSYQIELIRFLSAWSRLEGKTVIGVLHDINLAMLLAENVLLLEDGYMRAHGANSEVFSSGALADAYNMDVASYMLEMLRKWEDMFPREEGREQ